MKLEAQLAQLAEIGLTLNAGVTIDDLLVSFGREAYEEKPFNLLLFTLGTEVEAEPWGRNVCDAVWNFDTECVYGNGSYASIAKRLCEMSGNPDWFGDVADHVSFAEGSAWVSYSVNGRPRKWNAELFDDWVDTMVLSYMISDVERDGKRFYGRNNGQAVVLFYVSAEQAAALNQLPNVKLRPMSG